MKRIFSILAFVLLVATSYAKDNSTILPKMHGALAGKVKGQIKKDVFVAQLGVLPHLDQDQKILDTWKDYRYLVTNFTVQVIRDNKEIFTKTTKGPIFDEETHGFFQTMKAGDVVRILYITCFISPINKTITADPVEVTIR